MTLSCRQHRRGQAWPRKRTNPVMSTHILISQHLGNTVTGKKRRSEGDQERKRLSRTFSPCWSVGGPARNALTAYRILGLLQPCGPHRDTRPHGPGLSPGQKPHKAGGPGGRAAWALQLGEGQPGEKTVPPLPATFCCFPMPSRPKAALLWEAWQWGREGPASAAGMRERERNRDRAKKDTQRRDRERETF